MSRHSVTKQDSSPNERLNMRKPLPTVADLHAQGKSMRESVPRELHGQWKPDAQREDVLSINDPLFLQIKEALSPAHAPYLPLRRSEIGHDGQRVVTGQRALQSSSDVMLGWTEMDGHEYYVRQMKNLKASIPIEWLTGDAFNFYCWACGALLARAHAKTSEAAIIAGYCGTSKPLQESLADWAEAYGDQTESDHARLRAAVKRSETGLI